MWLKRKSQIKKKFITQDNKNISIKICETQKNNTKENFIAQKGNRKRSEYFYATFKQANFLRNNNNQKKHHHDCLNTEIKFNQGELSIKLKFTKIYLMSFLF